MSWLSSSFDASWKLAVSESAAGRDGLSEERDDERPELDDFDLDLDLLGSFSFDVSTTGRGAGDALSAASFSESEDFDGERRLCSYSVDGDLDGDGDIDMDFSWRMLFERGEPAAGISSSVVYNLPAAISVDSTFEVESEFGSGSCSLVAGDISDSRCCWVGRRI
jgi:hypothetical protein